MQVYLEEVSEIEMENIQFCIKIVLIVQISKKKKKNPTKI